MAIRQSGKVYATKEGGSGGSLPDYSTEEHKTGRKWIDGRDEYEKTIVDSYTGTFGGAHDIPHGVSNIDLVTCVTGYLLDTMEPNLAYVLPRIDGGNGANIGVFFVNDTNVTLSVSSAFGTNRIYGAVITLRYVKKEV